MALRRIERKQKRANKWDKTRGAQPEKVNHPAHYGGDTVYETIKVIEAWGLDKNFDLGNAVKYISRAEHKGNTLEDLKKAAWYLNREIQKLEAEAAKKTK